ncbi:MAG: alginate O-acetyltransferase AlgX-related protein, partial [Bacteroidia bacterium]
GFIGLTGLVKDPSLKGAVEYSADVDFSWKGWFNSSWQEQKEKYLNENFGTRNYFVRLHNEIDYRLFYKFHARAVVVGKEEYLYESSYITCYLGWDFLGNDSLLHIINNIEKAQKILEERGKTLILVLAPGKASFYPEFLPVIYDNVKRGQTNYETLSEHAENRNLNFINFSAYFKVKKKDSPYLIFPKFGIHWSQYAMCIAADSMIKYMEFKRQIEMDHLMWNEIESKEAFGFDYDGGRGLNLLSYLKGPLMGYPKTWVSNNKNKTKPAVLIVADSFYSGIYDLSVSEAYKDSHFWYYNNVVYPEYNSTTVFVKDLNFEEQVNKHDVFILMATEPNFATSSWGFIDSVLNLKIKESK